MKNYDEIELEIGINCGEPVSDSDSWIKFTQSMRRNAIADTELAMFRKAHPAKLPKLQSKPINATDYITSNVLTLRDNLARVIELYHETTAGVQTYFTERNKAWDKLQDSVNFTTADPYFYLLGERQYKLQHSISSPNVFYIIAQNFPQTYDASFDYGETYCEFEGLEEAIINGATGRLLLKVNQAEKAGIYLKLFQGSLNLLA